MRKFIAVVAILVTSSANAFVIDETCTFSAKWREFFGLEVSQNCLYPVSNNSGYIQSGDSGTGTQSGDSGTGTQSGDSGTGTESGDSGTGTKSGNSGTGIESGDSGTGNG